MLTAEKCGVGCIYTAVWGEIRLARYEIRCSKEICYAEKNTYVRLSSP